jgi:hypothetical protein
MPNDDNSIQQHDTKMAALEALEHPPTLRPESDPTPPAQRPASEAEVAMRAEIDCLRAELTRLSNRQSELALRDHPPASAPQTYVHTKRRTKRPDADPVFHRTRSAKNLITFPGNDLRNGKAPAWSAGNHSYFPLT